MKININDLAKIRGIGPKTIERVREFALRDIATGSVGFDPSLFIKGNSIVRGDCLNLMNGIPDSAIDMVLCDLPYGNSACSWDSVLPLDVLWAHYRRIVKKDGAIVLTANQPFTSMLITSNLQTFRYCWVWDKERGYNFATVNIRPFNSHEDVCVFYQEQPTYNPQMLDGEPYVQKQGYVGESKQTGLHREAVVTVNEGERYPLSIISFYKRESGLHPTQKPVGLFEYLIKTYTNKGDIVLDNTAGACTAAIAAINTDREYICIEQEEKYYNRGRMWADLVGGGMHYKEAEKIVKERLA